MSFAKDLKTVGENAARGAVTLAVAAFTGAAVYFVVDTHDLNTAPCKEDPITGGITMTNSDGKEVHYSADQVEIDTVAGKATIYADAHSSSNRTCQI